MNPPRVLICRLSAIGDVVQTVPVACALRDRFPEAFIGWAVEGRAATLLEGHPAIDELIVLPRGWLKSPATVWQLRRRLRGLRFDCAIDVQGLSKAAILGWLSGARRRIGFRPPLGRELSPWLNTENVETPAQHVVEQNLQLLAPLGISQPAVRFDLPERPEDGQAAARILGGLGLNGGFALINPGAGWPSKLWPTERFAAVAAHLERRHTLPTLVVWAGPDEERMAREIAAGCPGVRIAPNTSLCELAALARRGRIFVGSDTGPLHLAAAVGTRCVGLYGPWPASRHAPYGPGHIALQKMVFDGPTHAKRRAPKIYMEAISVADVCEACDRILAGPAVA